VKDGYAEGHELFDWETEFYREENFQKVKI